MTGKPGALMRELEDAIARGGERKEMLWEVADAIRRAGGYRWLGLYDVDHAAGMVTNIVWSGPGAPAHPTFPLTLGLTGSAIAEKRLINVADVTRDPRYVAAFSSTRSEMIVPIFDGEGREVIGTIDVESAQVNAFDAAAQELLRECARVIQPLWAAR
jgi:putative methionine-R-sulfoxide reductase with GAF domain